MFKCVVFDLGDTLIGSTNGADKASDSLVELGEIRKAGFGISEDAYLKAFSKTRGEFSKRKDQKKYSDYFFAETVLKYLGIKQNKSLAVKMSNAFFDCQKRHTKLEPNAKRVLSFLEKNKIVIGLISNGGSKKARKWIDFFGITNFFDVILISEETGFNKSEIKPFRIFLERINKKRGEKILPEECLMVGNNAFEDASAKKLGIKVALYLPCLAEKEKQKFKHDFEIKNLTEIKKLIKKY